MACNKFCFLSSEGEDMEAAEIMEEIRDVKQIEKVEKEIEKVEKEIEKVEKEIEGV